MKTANNELTHVKEDNYVTILGQFRIDYDLKGNELMIYSIIYGFSQEKDHWFHGSLQYLADWTGTTKKCCIDNLQSLEDKGLIIKHVTHRNGVRICMYKATSTITETTADDII